MQKNQVYGIGVVLELGSDCCCRKMLLCKSGARLLFQAMINLHVGSEDIFLSLKIWLAQESYTYAMTLPGFIRIYQKT